MEYSNKFLRRNKRLISGRLKILEAMHFVKFLQFLFLILFNFIVFKNNGVSAEETVITYYGVLGESIGLPCNLETKNTYSSSIKILSDTEDDNQYNKPINIEDVYGNEVSLILWYRHGSSGVPIYAVDARQNNLNQAQHQSYLESEKIDFNNQQKLFINKTVDEIFTNVKGRFVFNLAEQPPKLWIRKLEFGDEGEYRCRVDYRGDRTQNSLVYLRVLVPPTSLKILNSLGKELKDQIGPYEEQEYLSLICLSNGGKPLPQLNWYHNDKLIDSSYIVNVFNSRVENELTIGRLKRNDLDQKFECRAETNKTVLKSTFVVIDLYLKPLTINLTQVNKKLIAGHKAEFECSSSGSRPAAEFIFFKDDKPIRNSGNFVESKGNLSFAKLVTIVNTADDGKKLTCRAINSKFTKSNDFIEQSIILDVNYLPQLTVNLGAALIRENIREDTDVYLECSVKSNPPVQEIRWTFEEEPLVYDKAQGVLAINHTLILQQVKKEKRGYYACIVRNALGESKSQPFFLKIKYAPICRHSETQIIMVDKNELTQLNCEFNADPTELKFSWTLNYNENLVKLEELNSIPILPDSKNRSNVLTNSKINFHFTKQLNLHEFTSNNSQSILNYVVNEQTAFGEIHCQASNLHGSSINPCKFLILPHGPPCVPTNCDLKNTINEILLNCELCDLSLTSKLRKLESLNKSYRNQFKTILNNQDVIYNLKVYTPVNNGDLIKKPDWSENIDNQLENGIIQTNDNLNIMKFQQQIDLNLNKVLLVKNLTNTHKPYFKINDLKPATVYFLYLTALNTKGISEIRSFSISTLGSPERQLAMDAIEQVSLNPLLLGFIAFVSIVVFFSTLILVVIRRKAGQRHCSDLSLNSNIPNSNNSSTSITTSNSANKLKKSEKNKKSKYKRKCVTLQSVTKLNELPYKNELELKETNYNQAGKTLNKNNSIYDYHDFTQDAHSNLFSQNNLMNSNITPSPVPSSCNTNTILNPNKTFYNSSSNDGSSLQLNSSYNYSTSGLNFNLNKNNTLNDTSNMLNQSLNAIQPCLNNSNSSVKKVIFIGDSIQNTENLYSNNSTSNYSSMPQPIYGQDLKVTDVYYGAINNSQNIQNSNISFTPVKLPRIQFLQNSKLNINSINGQPLPNLQNSTNSMYFPVVSYRLSKEQINHNNSNNGNHATPV